ncbi:aminoacyl--tRNA ligase-related protein [Rossellomorea sp. H39__3]
MNEYSFRLSYRDPEDKEKYFDDDEMWNKAQGMLKEAMDELEIDYFEAEGEAAFYGPKLDVQVKTALGKEETLSTVQLDFLLPERFDLTYVGEDGKQHRPVVIHRGVVSTMERFVAFLIEEYKGHSRHGSHRLRYKSSRYHRTCISIMPKKYRKNSRRKGCVSILMTGTKRSATRSVKPR